MMRLCKKEIHARDPFIVPLVVRGMELAQSFVDYGEGGYEALPVRVGHPLPHQQGIDARCLNDVVLVACAVSDETQSES